MEILAYLLKVNLSIAVFYLVYRICFGRDTFFTLRRFILLAMIVVSVGYPFLDISFWIKQTPAINEVAVIYMQFFPEPTIPSSDVTVKTFPYENIALCIYTVIAGFFLLRLLVRLASIIRFRYHCMPVEINSQQACLIQKEANPFSFFNWIFVNPSMHQPAEIHEIMTHELVHVRQFHSIDILLSELTCVFCWFNPFAWMLKDEVHRNLEFLVDNQVIRSGIDSQGYQHHLLRLAGNPTSLVIANQFRNFPLKERIMMINAKQSSKIKLIAYTLLLPLALLFIVVDNLGAIVKQYNTYDIEKSEEVLLVVDEPPTFPGGMGELTRYLNNNVRYPAEAEKKKIQGRVVCSFVINSTGMVSQVEVISGVHPLLDSEAQRVLYTMPRWNPGKHQGVAVAVQYTVPVMFRMQE